MFKKIELFLLDMDGTLYFETNPIPGALEFINTLVKANKRFVYLTNNSSLNKSDYIKKLHKMGFPCQDDQIFTSGMATALFLQQERKDKSVYLVGTKALVEEFKAYNILLTNDAPDIVVVGFDRELTYEKLEKACYFLEEGAEFLATNVDKVCPIPNNRYIPDCGSICHMLEVATKKQARYLGKPNKEMINVIATKMGLKEEQIVMIGDRIYTDILTAHNAGSKSVLVLSGETKVEDLKNANIQADIVVPSVASLIKYLN